MRLQIRSKILNIFSVLKDIKFTLERKNDIIDDNITNIKEFIIGLNTLIDDVSSAIENKFDLLSLFRHQFFYGEQLNSKTIKDHVYYDLKSHILAIIS